MKKSDLYREYARVIDMCEGTVLEPWECVKLNGETIREPAFKSNPEDYTFALAIVEGKPVFDGDKLYNRNGIEFYAEKISNFGSIVNANYSIGDLPSFCSWNPPKPRTVMVELLREDAEYFSAIQTNLPQNNRFYDACRKALEGSK